MEGKKIIKNYIRMAIFFALYCLFMFTDINIYIFKPLSNCLGNSIDGYQTYVILINVLMYCILLVSSLFLVPNIYYVDFKIFQKKTPKKRWLELLIGYGIFYTLEIIGALITTLITLKLNGETTESVNEQQINAILNAKAAWIYIPIVVIVGPIVEEITFRGILQSTIIGSKFQDKFNPRVFFGILITSLLFGFLHVFQAGDYVQIFPYVFMGVGLGVVTYHTKSIYPSIIIHMINNFLSVMLSLLLLII